VRKAYEYEKTVHDNIETHQHQEKNEAMSKITGVRKNDVTTRRFTRVRHSGLVGKVEKWRKESYSFSSTGVTEEGMSMRLLTS